MRRILRRFRRRTDGIAAVEFAFIAPIFVAFVLTIFQVGYSLIQTAVMEQEIANAARAVKVGRAFDQAFVAADADPSCPYGSTDALGQPCKCANGKQCFFDEVCDSLRAFVGSECATRLSVSIERYASISALPSDFATSCPDAPGYDLNNSAYDPGRANDIVVLRACMVIDTYNPLMTLLTEGDGSAKRRFRSVQLQRNEPYDPDDDS